MNGVSYTVNSILIQTANQQLLKFTYILQNMKNKFCQKKVRKYLIYSYTTK